MFLLSAATALSFVWNRCWKGHRARDTLLNAHTSPCLTSVCAGTDLVTPSGLQQPLNAESLRAAVRPDGWPALVEQSVEGRHQALANIEKKKVGFSEGCERKSSWHTAGWECVGAHGGGAHGGAGPVRQHLTQSNQLTDDWRRYPDPPLC